MRLYITVVVLQSVAAANNSVSYEMELADKRQRFNMLTNIVKVWLPTGLQQQLQRCDHDLSAV